MDKLLFSDRVRMCYSALIHANKNDGTTDSLSGNLKVLKSWILRHGVCDSAFKAAAVQFALRGHGPDLVSTEENEFDDGSFFEGNVSLDDEDTPIGLLSYDFGILKDIYDSHHFSKLFISDNIRHGDSIISDSSQIWPEPESVKENGGISLFDVQNALSEMRASGTTDSVTNFIEKHYSSMKSLNNSFISQKNHPASEFPLLGVQMITHARAAFELLIRTGSSTIIESLYSSCLSILGYLVDKYGINHQFASEERFPAFGEEGLRFFCILFVNPLLIRRQFLSLLASCVIHLSDGDRQTLIVLLSQFPKNYFGRLVKINLSFLSDRLIFSNRWVSSRGPSPGIHAVCEFLSLLLEANARFATMKRKSSHSDSRISLHTDKSETLIPVSLFRSTAVCQRIHVKNDVKRWMGISKGLSFCHYPFLFTPAVKGAVFRTHSLLKMCDTLGSAFVHGTWIERSRLLAQNTEYVGLRGISEISSQIVCHNLLVLVRRDHLVEDTVRELKRNASFLDKPLKVVFEHEEGMDVGGVQKEFFMLIVRHLFDPSCGLFTVDEGTRLSWFFLGLLQDISAYMWAGVVVGLALYNGVTLDVRFPMVVFKYLLCEDLRLENLSIEDLDDFSPSVASGLRTLLEFVETDDSTVEDIFGLNFVVSSSTLGEDKEHELIPEGRNTPVTVHNRVQYVSLYLEWLIWKSVQGQVSAFKQGFDMVFPKPDRSSVLSLLSPPELELLLCGTPVVDLRDLERVAQYDNGYDRNSRVVEWLWHVVNELDDALKRQFLSFVTGSDRVPVNGLGSLGFKVVRHANIALLPSAMTCFNTLFLPEYNNRSTLRDKLLMSLNNSEGFGLI